MKTWSLACASLLSVVVAGGCGAAVPEGDASNGEKLFPVHCASCHGDDGKSGTAGEDVPGAVADDGVDEIFLVIQNGKGNGEMPAFKDELTDQEIADIIAWLETQ